MSDERPFDIVLYGASGYTGAWVLEQYYKSEFCQKYKLAISGRNKEKLENVLKNVGELIDIDLTKVPIIVATNDNELNSMAKKTRVIINVAGPYRLCGEAVVRAAVENGTHHLDISGEPAFLEKMQLLYSEKAKETGSYIIGAAGWDSIPVDLGIGFLQKKFPGTVAYVETFAELHHPPKYAVNNGTYQTILLAVSQKENLGEIRGKIMPEKLENVVQPPKRSIVWYNDELKSHAIPFPGSDRSVVNRTQYYESTINNKHPVAIQTYILKPSLAESWLTILWFGLLSVICKFQPILRFCQNNPDLVSFGSFSSAGPKREFVKKATFSTYIKGYGWKNSPVALVNEKPTKTLTVRVDGPDAGYVSTAAFVLSSALTVLEDEMPKEAGVYTTAIAFEKTNIIDRLATFDITFNIEADAKKDE